MRLLTIPPSCLWQANIEEDLLLARRDLFSNLDCVFFDTTSIYFEGEGGQTIGELGHSKEHRPDLHQMVVGIILPLRSREVIVDGNRYIVCLNEKQARKDAADRQAIIDSLVEKLKNNPKSLVGNKGYRKYLKLDRETIAVNQEKIEEEARYDGKWVSKTSTTLRPRASGEPVCVQRTGR